MTLAHHANRRSSSRQLDAEALTDFAVATGERTLCLRGVAGVGEWPLVGGNMVENRRVVDAVRTLFAGCEQYSHGANVVRTAPKMRFVSWYAPCLCVSLVCLL